MARAAATLRRSIELDFVRGIALLLVMMLHYKTHELWFTSPGLERWQTMGWAGVDLFFVLSGYLVGGLLMREWRSTGSVDAWRFLKRRAFKIWPSYYLLIFVAAAIHVRPLRTFFWQNLLNVQNYVPSSLSHTWSLAVEEHFYLGAAGLLALWSSRRWKPRALMGFCLLTAVVVESARAWECLHHRPYYFYTHLRMDALLLGVFLAALQQFEPAAFERLRAHRALLGIAVTVAVVAVVYNPSGGDAPWLITVADYGCVAALLLLSRPRGGKTHSWLYRAVARLGIYSYGIYLWHVSVLRPVDWVVAHVPRPFASTTSTLLPYIAATGVGIVMTRLVELPALRLRERLVPPRTPEPAPSLDGAAYGAPVTSAMAPGKPVTS